VYSIGLIRLWRSAGVGRGVQVRQAWSFAAGMLTLVAALLSPIDPFAEALNWVHMVQHMLLMMVAAPLCIIGAPGIVAIWAMPVRWRHGAAVLLHAAERWRIRRYFLWQPIVLWLLFAFVLWIWHLPALYEAALRHPRLHDFQHLGFFLAACLFWRVLLDPLSRLRLNPALAVLYLFTASLHATLLGVFMALSPRPWYGWYVARTEEWNLTPLEDQQLAGFIMWMPACMIYALAAAVVFGLWLHRPTNQAPPIPSS
jgi:putative membrane protein